MKRWYGVTVLVAVLAALTLSGPAQAMAGPETAGQPVPFKGRSSGVVTVVGVDPVAGIISTHVEGKGQATQLGRFTVTADVDIDEATGNAQGTWTLTAANGDLLFVTMAGRGIDPTHGLGTFTVVGGTGRFQGAAGAYEQLITFAATPGTTDIVPYTDMLEGTISTGRQ